MLEGMVDVLVGLVVDVLLEVEFVLVGVQYVLVQVVLVGFQKM
ncbi:hypothetical protein A2U01_0066951, partial [Trifolium medium]|nr:hypothetical protein [Trifolium medium]